MLLAAEPDVLPGTAHWSFPADVSAEQYGEQERYLDTEIQSVLESLDIPVEVVESGRRLRWNAAVVLRIPEHRMAEAMLALGMKGFADVMAYQSSDAEL